MFVKRFEPMVRMIDDTVVDLGLYDSYEAANDAVIMFAARELPTETVKAYQIVEVNINTAVWPEAEG